MVFNASPLDDWSSRGVAQVNIGVEVKPIATFINDRLSASTVCSMAMVFSL
jgi:hypothetical protein